MNLLERYRAVDHLGKLANRLAVPASMVPVRTTRAIAFLRISRNPFPARVRDQLFRIATPRSRDDNRTQPERC